jgi:hypothetical protein
MVKEPMEAKGIRLPPEIWRAIERRAEAEEISRSQWLRQVLSGLVLLPATVQITPSVTPNGQENAINWRTTDE